jgi:hypothetical protein
MRKTILALLILVTSLPIGAFAMGSGDPYLDAQTGLTYSLYKPVNTLGLSQTEFKLLPCGGGGEEWVYTKFSKGKKKIEVMQAMKGLHCSDPGLSVKSPSIKINGTTASVFVYCNPTNKTSAKKCSTKDFAKAGGYLSFTLPGYYGMKATTFQVQGTGGITYEQIKNIARSLTPASTKPSN